MIESRDELEARTTELARLNEELQAEIAERERAEEALRALSSRYEAILAAVPDIIVEVDENKVYRWANRAGLEFFGEDVLGKEAAFYFEGEQETYEIVQPLFNGDPNVVYVESWQRRKDGEKRLLAWWCRMLKDKDGNVIGALSTARDITELKRAEQDRLAHLRFLESMGQIDRVIRGTSDPDQMMLDVLDTVLRMFNCDRAWLLHPCDPDAASWRVPVECTRPEYPGAHSLGGEVPMQPEVAEFLRTVLGSDGPVAFGPGAEHPLPPENAKRFRYQAEMTMAIYPKVGKPWVFGLHQCSYPRVWTKEEERLFQAIGRRIADSLTSLLTHRDLRESEQRFRTLVEQAADGIFLHDLEGRFVEVNSRACENLGYTRDEMLGMTVADVDPTFFTGDRATRYWQSLPPGKAVAFETQNRRKDGSLFPADVRLCLIEMRGRKLILGSARDITERKQAEQEREQMQARLLQTQKLESIGVLAGGIAHDFNNLLTVISGNAQFLRRTLSLNPAQAEALEAIDTAAMHAAEMTRSLQAFSRPRKPQTRLTDANTFVADAYRLLRRMMPATIDFQLDLETEPCTIEVDPGQMQQLLVNLCVNSRDAMPTGGLLQIQTRHVAGATLPRPDAEQGPCARYVRIRVNDTGCGMDDETLQRVFDPYFTTKTMDRGTGLGLAIVYQIVEAHHGAIDIHSQPGHGTYVDVFFPAVQPSAAGASENGILSLRGEERILVVDDEPMVGSLLKTVLEDRGYKVSLAHRPQEALDAVSAADPPFDLAILDYALPGVTGDRCLSDLRAMSPQLEAILVTGCDLNEADVSGCRCEILHKPFSVSAIVKTVRDVLDKRKE